MQNCSNYTEVMYANAFERVWRTVQIIFILIIVNYVRHRQILCHLLFAQWRSIWMEPKWLQLYEIWISLGQPFSEFLTRADVDRNSPAMMKVADHLPFSRKPWPKRVLNPNKKNQKSENWVSIQTDFWTIKKYDHGFWLSKYLAEQISIFH